MTRWTRNAGLPRLAHAEGVDAFGGVL